LYAEIGTKVQLLRIRLLRMIGRKGCWDLKMVVSAEKKTV